MPHFTVEYTPNAKALLTEDAQKDFKPLFTKLHAIMGEEIASIMISKCKGRAYLADNYLTGHDEDAGFVHMTLLVAEPPEPMPDEKFRAIGDRAKATVKEFFGNPDPSIKIDFTLEIRIMPKKLYWKNDE